MLAILLSIVAYEASKFAPNPDDTVILDHCDTFEILSESIECPKNIKDIKDFKLASGYQPVDNYCWPGHPGTLDDAFYSSERDELIKKYTKSTDITRGNNIRCIG